ncbi:hypothetical protein EJB05_50192 [Eragrostis curvula]|uniref:RING-type domain-containing protein n=1 Tax=Eragrostis curvula TaxID=38414 RepID=A0A5J9SZ09_9POAL|nr:hypothetical protein EJB05_50192 [Eragrostis curvula]
MAVEAHHLLHMGGQNKLATQAAGWEGGGGICWDQAPPASTAQAACYGRQLQGYPYQYQQASSCAGLMAAAAPSPAPMMMGQQQQYGQVCAASDSGVTFGGAQDPAAAAPRKRKRADQPQLLGLGASGVAAHLQQQLVDVDRLVLQHTAKMWAELTEQRRRHARQVAAAVEAAAAKRLRAKDEEISRIGRVNWALEERVRSLLVEAQVWRDLAQSNEAAANALRAELQHALDAQQQQQARRPGVADGADDAASCCCGENDVGAGEEVEVGTAAAAAPWRACTMCGEGAAEVLLLPCRHLCACAPCADAARACPACGGDKNGSVRVNFS